MVPALALPGWWIDPIGQAGTSEVRVFNPAGRGGYFMADGTAAVLDGGQIALITQALVMRYPIDPQG